MVEYLGGHYELRAEYEDLDQKLETDVARALRKLPYGALVARFLVEGHQEVYGQTQLDAFIKDHDVRAPVYRKHTDDYLRGPYTLFEKKLRDISETSSTAARLAALFEGERRELEKVAIIRAEVLLNSLLVHALDSASSSDARELKRACTSHQDELRYSLYFLLPRERRGSLHLIYARCFSELASFLVLCRRHLGDQAGDFEAAVEALNPDGEGYPGQVEVLLAARTIKARGAMRFVISALVLVVLGIGFVVSAHIAPGTLSKVEQAVLDNGQFLAPLGGISLVYSLYYLHKARR